ncbi:MAG: DUF2147 domain-containing protein [Saprospiraceae bacterium]|nr:DUF2147 domain-containing protein [Saprospiraceae bacterium]MBK8668176.1 DUF2147 domain-containing protein [Saprospiraceae bacterium]MBL0099352.1 DUF2147 domain-containing protein [Saprospiraceae bacterium]
MHKSFIVLVLILAGKIAMAQSPVGIWKNLDDTDGKEKSHIEIYEHKGKLRAKVIKLLPAATITKCDACTGPNKGKALVGLDIVWDLQKNGNIWEGGQILDPKKGKIYDCKIEMDGKDKLNVRGFMGVSIFGRTQVWYKVK